MQRKVEIMARFSPEYIDFVTKNEPIQARWRKRGVRLGDWYVYGNGKKPWCADRYDFEEI